MHRDTPYKFLQLEIYGVPELQGKNYKKTLPAIDKRVSRIVNDGNSSRLSCSDF